MRKILYFITALMTLPVQGQNTAINFNLTTGNIVNAPTGTTAFNFPAGRLFVGGAPVGSGTIVVTGDVSGTLTSTGTLTVGSIGGKAVTLGGSLVTNGALTLQGTGTFNLATFVPSTGTVAYSNTATFATTAGSLTGTTVSVAQGGTGTNAPGLVAGTNITISGSWPNQTINNTYAYTLPAATTSSLGGVVVGSGLNVSSGTISNAGVTSFNTRTGAVTLQASDLAISGASLTGLPTNTSLYPTLNQSTTGTAGGVAWSVVTATPTTLGGYGITNGVANTVTVNGHALSSNVIVSASDITTGTLPHGQLPALVSGDIPNNAANTSGSAASLSGSITLAQWTQAANAATSTQTVSGLFQFTNTLAQGLPLGFSDTGIGLSSTGSVNSYYQLVVQNTSTGTGASADIVVANNNSTATTYYGNFGINGGNYTGSGAMNLPNATYLTSSNGDLAIGSLTSNAIHFVINGGTTDAMTISTGSVVTIPSAVVTGSFTGQGSGTWNGTVAGAVTSAQAVNAPGNAVITSTATSAVTQVTTMSGFEAPNFLQVIGPAGGNKIDYGDSLTAGVGGGGGAQGQVYGSTFVPGFTGAFLSPVDDFSTLPVNGFLQDFNLGISGQTTLTGYNQYAGANSGTVTGTLTAGSTTVTLPSTTGMAGTMAIWANGGGIPYCTTGTLNTGTLYLSAPATYTGTRTLYFGTAVTSQYGLITGFNANAHVLSNAATGTLTFFVLKYGTNSYASNGVTASGVATTGSGTITGMSVTTSVSITGATITGVNGYQAWGGTGSGLGADFTALGTVTSASSSQVVVSNPSAVLSSMTVFKFTPLITAAGSDTNAFGTAGTSTLTTNYLNLVNAALNDGDQVMVCTLYPFVSTGGVYAQGQYDEQRLVFNTWLRTTFGTGTYTNGTSNTVTLCDEAYIPFLQYIGNSYYSNYRSAGAFPHLNVQGYGLVASFEGNAFALNYPQYMQGYMPQGMRGGLTPGNMPANTIVGGQINPLGSGTTTIYAPGVTAFSGQIAVGSGGNLSSGSMTRSGAVMDITAIGTGEGVNIYSNGGSGNQLALRDKTDNRKYMQFYFDPTNNVGCINAAWTSNANEPLSLNPGSQQPIQIDFVSGSSPFTENLQVGSGGTAGTGSAVMAALDLKATTSTVTGSSAGNVVFSEPFRGATYKKVVCFMGSTFSGTAAYTFPLAFANTPIVVNSDSAATSVSATAVTLTGGGTLPRIVILEGY